MWKHAKTQSGMSKNTIKCQNLKWYAKYAKKINLYAEKSKNLKWYAHKCKKMPKGKVIYRITQLKKKTDNFTRKKSKSKKIHREKA